MSASTETTGLVTHVSPVVMDLSAFIISGAVSSQAGRFNRATEGRTPAQGVQDGVDAERLGYRRVWLSERWDIKQADVILSAIGARTTRLEIGTGVIVPTTRQAWSAAALGATFHACHGERFILGLGRGDAGWFRGMGIPTTSYAAMVDYVDIYRRLWAGEVVTYDGPAGTFDHLTFAETYHGQPPQIWFAGFAFDKGAAVVARCFDGILLPPLVTPQMVRDATTRIAAACERIGRDPDEVRICAPVVTAPDMDEFEAMSISAARLVTYLQYPAYGDVHAKANGWDLEIVRKMRSHQQFQDLHRAADFSFHRHQLMGPASMLPLEWIHDCAAIGTVDECMTNLQRFRDAGADEIATYGSTPMQNAGLVAAWRDRQAVSTTTGSGDDHLGGSGQAVVGSDDDSTPRPRST